MAWGTQKECLDKLQQCFGGAIVRPVYDHTFQRSSHTYYFKWLGQKVNTQGKIQKHTISEGTSRILRSSHDTFDKRGSNKLALFTSATKSTTKLHVQST